MLVQFIFTTINKNYTFQFASFKKINTVNKYLC